MRRTFLAWLNKPATTPRKLTLATGTAWFLELDVGMLTCTWCFSRKELLQVPQIIKTNPALSQSPIQTSLILSINKICFVRFSGSGGRHVVYAQNYPMRRKIMHARSNATARAQDISRHTQPIVQFGNKLCSLR